MKRSKSYEKMIAATKRGDAARSAYLAEKRRTLPRLTDLQDHLRDGGDVRDTVGEREYVR